MTNRYLAPMMAVLVGLLSVAAAGSYWRTHVSRERAMNAAASLKDCIQLAEQITQLRSGPRRANLQTQSDTELSRLIEAAAEEAGMPKNQIARIEPKEPFRVSDSDYKNQATDVELRPVSLKQLIAFVDAVSRDTGIQVHFVWMNALEGTDGARASGESWNAQLTLTHLVFAPKSDPLPDTL